MAEWWINILYVLVPLGALALTASFVNMLLAPSRIDKEQRDRIAELESKERCPLVLEWNKSRDTHWTHKKEILEVSIWAVNRSQIKTIDDVTISLRVEAIRNTNMQNARGIAQKLKDVPLLKKTDRLQNEPQIVHTLHPEDRIEFWILKAQRGCGAFKVYHARRERMQTRDGQYFWRDTISGGLDSGTYRLTVTLKGRDMESQSASFLATNTGRTLTFQTD